MTHCSFCGRPKEELPETFLGSGETAICADCVFTAFDTIGRQHDRRYVRVAYGVFVVIASIGRLLTFGPKTLWPPKLD